MDWKRGEGKGQESRNTLMQFHTVQVICLVFKTIRSPYLTVSNHSWTSIFHGGETFTHRLDIHQPSSGVELPWSKGADRMWRWYLQKYIYRKRFFFFCGLHAHRETATERVFRSVRELWWFSVVTLPTATHPMYTVIANTQIPMRLSPFWSVTDVFSKCAFVWEEQKCNSTATPMKDPKPNVATGWTASQQASGLFKSVFFSLQP